MYGVPLRQARTSPIDEVLDRHWLLAACALVALTLAAHAMVLAAPGFYSADEWQKVDYIEARGFADFVRAYLALRPGPEFGYPVRPIGFLQQGVAALWMRSAPWAAHLMSVMNHALVALTFVWVLRRAAIARRTAWIAGALFVISPLTSIATGWVAANFDQLYVFFLLLLAALVVRPAADRMGLVRAACILLVTVAALLSKETAVVAPAVMALIAYAAWLRDRARFSWSFHAQALFLAALPVSLYLGYRGSAIGNSLLGDGIDFYTPSIANVPWNIWRLFAFPFRPNLLEMSDAVFASVWQPSLAVLAHAVLVFMVARMFGARWAILYLAGYFVFLIPVVFIPSPGAHCLYGSALAMSLAMAAVLVRSVQTRSTSATLLVAVGVSVLFAHAWLIQASMFETARCQTRFLADADSALAAEDAAGRRPLRIIAEQGPGARAAARVVGARERYMRDGAPLVVVEQGSDERAPTQSHPLRLQLTSACALIPASASTSN